MKKVLFTVLAGVLAGMTFVPALAQDDDEKKFEFNGEVRVRYEYLNNYLDLVDNDGSAVAEDDSFSITPYRVYVGMTGNFSNNVKGHVDLQYLGNFGDQLSPQWGFNYPPNQSKDAYSSLGTGVNLYTGWIEAAKIGGSDFGLRIGRQEHVYGTELFLGDNNYYGGLSFDGATGMWQRGHSDLNFFYYKLTELNGDFWNTIPGVGGGAMDSDLFGATYDWKFDTMGTVGGYILFVQDMDGYGPVGPGSPPDVPNDNSSATYGARWNREMMTGDKLNMFDWNIEAAVQDGDSGDPSGPEIKLSGWILEGWFAFNFNAGNTHGRAHIGTLMTSGDDPTTLDENEGFISYYGDFHAYNRFGDLDWVDGFAQQLDVTTYKAQQNITDFNIGYEHWFGERHYVMAAFHIFQQTEDAVAGVDDLGDEIDLTYNFQYSKNLGFQVTAGQANPGEAAENIYIANGVPAAAAGDPVQRITVMALLNW